MQSSFQKRILGIAASSALLLGVTGAAQAVPFTEGNIFVSTGAGTVEERTPTGTLVQTLNVGTGFITGSAFDQAGNFYATRFSNNLVQRFDVNANNLGTFGGGYSTPESVVIDASGNVYVGSIGGGIRKFDSAGNFLSAATNAGRVDFMDLFADQQTMIYGREGQSVHSINVATNTVNPNFSEDVEQAFAMRILANGNVLVADGADIELLNSSGTQINSYDIVGTGLWFALNIDLNGTSFWSATTDGLVAQFDIATGNVLNQWDRGADAWGLAIFGEVTQGGGGGGGTVPEPATLLIVGLGLVALGFARRRRDQ